MTTADRVLGVLRLFSLERPEWSVDSAAQALGLSQSTAYQYFRSLGDAGLIVTSRAGRYVLGPAILELDWLTRRSDPFVQTARPLLAGLSDLSPAGGLALLCRLYGSRVMCVDQYATHAPAMAVSYERGRPMPLIRGSASKVILANLPLRPLRQFHAKAVDDIARAGLGADWEGFKAALREIRRAGYSVTRGELDVGVFGVSAPVFSPDNEIVGSIGLVLPDTGEPPHPDIIRRVRDAGRRLSLALKRRVENE